MTQETVGISLPEEVLLGIVPPKCDGRTTEQQWWGHEFFPYDLRYRLSFETTWDCWSFQT